ncbi:hypothetical protein MKW94_000773 [Papaver nudicaule]|uniref:Uncharacterized protein n=1 Tax=Papaver nudicaule TaxID=74823 RepID=A0AA41RSJ7_PAPNU|nr:hypothetical protein [Papaver nudicaule]
MKFLCGIYIDLALLELIFVSINSRNQWGASVFFYTIEIVKFQQPYYNSVSFIGSVLFPPRLVNSSSNLGAYTCLQVKYPKDPETNFRIFLSFWNKMAEISMQHVQKNDTIYVSGRLGSMTKVDLSGNEIKTFKLAVNELNFVENYPYCEPKESEEPALKIVSEDGDVACPVYAVSLFVTFSLFFVSIFDSTCKEEDKLHSVAFLSCR